MSDVTPPSSGAEYAFDVPRWTLPSLPPSEVLAKAFDDMAIDVSWVDSVRNVVLEQIDRRFIERHGSGVTVSLEDVQPVSETTLPSGVILVDSETPKSPVVEVKQQGLKCTFCDRRCSDVQVYPLTHFMADGFVAVWPTCAHGKYPVCKQCREQYFGCPVCGEQCEYT